MFQKIDLILYYSSKLPSTFSSRTPFEPADFVEAGPVVEADATLGKSGGLTRGISFSGPRSSREEQGFMVNQQVNPGRRPHPRFPNMREVEPTEFFTLVNPTSVLRATRFLFSALAMGLLLLIPVESNTGDNLLLDLNLNLDPIPLDPLSVKPLIPVEPDLIHLEPYLIETKVSYKVKHFQLSRNLSRKIETF